MTGDEPRLETCGVCKKQADPRHGLVYYAGEEWWVYRLFICDECQQNIAVQRSHHELCGECVERYPDGYSGLGLIGPLWNARDAFEMAHRNIFRKLPATLDEKLQYPGSAKCGLDGWLKKHFH